MNLTKAQASALYAALRKWGPIDAVLYRFGEVMMVELTRAPRGVIALLCLEGAFRRSRLVARWSVATSPPEVGRPMLAISFIQPSSSAELSEFRAALGLRYRWHGWIAYQEGDHFATLRIGEADREAGDRTEALPEYDFVELLRLPGVLSLSEYTEGAGKNCLFDVEVESGHDLFTVLRAICEKLGCYLPRN